MSANLAATSNIISVSITNGQSHVSQVFNRYFHGGNKKEGRRQWQSAVEETSPVNQAKFTFDNKLLAADCIDSLAGRQRISIQPPAVPFQYLKCEQTSTLSIGIETSTAKGSLPIPIVQFFSVTRRSRSDVSQ